MKGIQFLLPIGAASWRQSKYKIDYWESSTQLHFRAVPLCRGRKSFWKITFGVFYL